MLDEHIMNMSYLSTC